MNHSDLGRTASTGDGLEVRILAAGVLGPGLDALPLGGVELLGCVEPGPNPSVWVREIRDIGEHSQPDHRSETADERAIDRRRCVLMPALINAHAHLDLTHMGPCPADPLEPGSPASSFAAFGAHVLSSRLDDPAEIRRSVCDGAKHSLAGGVAAIGDIAGVWRTEPLEALRRSGLRGVSYLEVFGHGDRIDPSAARMRQLVELVSDAAAGLDDGRCRLGLSPHAPYSAGRRLFEACDLLSRERGLPVMTHLAECPEEREFIASATGAIRQLLERLGGVDATTEAEYRHGGTPIAHIAHTLNERWCAVHVNDCDDPGMASLRERGVAVVYCPRASAYFAHERHFGPHRYREMLDLGIPVALGTDSIICLPEDEADRLSPLDDARFLFRRDGTEPELLLEMLFVHGARALGIDEALVRLPSLGTFSQRNPQAADHCNHDGHELLGLIAVDVHTARGASAAERVMKSSVSIERITTETR